MTEEDARDWIRSTFGPAVYQRLDRFGELIVAAMERQNLIAPSTVSSLWARHIVDSAQLSLFPVSEKKDWVDIGSGAGLPGMVIASISERPVVLVEPRRLRVEFLEHAALALRLPHVSIVQTRAERLQLDCPADVISARAVSSLSDLLTMSEGFAGRETLFLLPKGKSANSEVATINRTWHGTFHVKQSIVDPQSGIIVASGVTRR